MPMSKKIVYKSNFGSGSVIVNGLGSFDLLSNIRTGNGEQNYVQFYYILKSKTMQITKHDNLDAVLYNLIKELKRGSVDKKHAFRYFSLATSKNGMPDQRMVVNRGMDEEDSILLYTDRRSDKVLHIGENANVHLLFYDAKRQLQIRLWCRAALNSPATTVEEVWEKVPPHNRREYQAEHKPGASIASPDAGWLTDSEKGADHFTIVRCFPQEIDVLQLNRDGHLRARFSKTGEGWEGEWVQP